jgi:hypothetical protein
MLAEDFARAAGGLAPRARARRRIARARPSGLIAPRRGACSAGGVPAFRGRGRSGERLAERSGEAFAQGALHVGLVLWADRKPTKLAHARHFTGLFSTLMANIGLSPDFCE